MSFTLDKANKDITISSYDKLINDMNKTEQELIDQIRYYKEHIEQIIRIEQLKEELSELKMNIPREITKRRIETQRITDYNTIVQTLQNSSHDAFENYTYERRRAVIIGNSTWIYVKTPVGNQKITYVFNKQKDNNHIYDVYCDTPTLKGIQIGQFNATDKKII
jgi:hypothetical protein